MPQLERYSPEKSDLDCITCEALLNEPIDRCPKSRKKCGHHCDHAWTHDQCCWCRAVFGDEDDPDFGKPR